MTRAYRTEVVPARSQTGQTMPIRPASSATVSTTASPSAPRPNALPDHLNIVMSDSGESSTRSTSGVSDVSAGVRPPVIEVVSDVVCPWCFIGKRRLEKALASLDRQDVLIRWKPFQLNPTTPKEGVDRQAYRIRKFGSLAYSQQLEARVAAAGAEEGIEFRFDLIKRTPNTLEAHRLIWFLRVENRGRTGGTRAERARRAEHGGREPASRLLHRRRGCR